MSRWSGVCTLIATETERDDKGVPHRKERRRRVPCNVFSLSAATYYVAAQAGVKPQAVIEIRSCAYSGETLVEFGGVTYSVDSRLISGADNIRLTLVERTGDR